jgi:hypothetical protein
MDEPPAMNGVCSLKSILEERGDYNINGLLLRSIQRVVWGKLQKNPKGKALL